MEIKENTFEGLEVLNDRLTKFNYNMEYSEIIYCLIIYSV